MKGSLGVQAESFLQIPGLGLVLLGLVIDRVVIDIECALGVLLGAAPVGEQGGEPGDAGVGEVGWNFGAVHDLNYGWGFAVCFYICHFHIPIIYYSNKSNIGIKLVHKISYLILVLVLPFTIY